LLSQAIQMNIAAVSTADQAPSSVTSSESSSWFGNLFRTPNLALAMGALVLTFSGVLGYLILRNQSLDSAMIASQPDTEVQKGGPSAGIEAEEPGATANTMANAANAAPSNASPTALAANSAANAARTDSITARSVENLPGAGRDSDKSVLIDGFSTSQPKSAAAPPPATTDTVAKERDQEELKSDDKEAKDENVLLGNVRQETEDRRASGAVLSKKKDAGPTRSGPAQSPPQMNTQTYDMPVTRNAGGKKFTNRSGAWYDTAYRGQATTNVRRGTDAYKNLDSGLRSIAETLGGTVIVVWKEKAYRIQ
jgi:hypothetical protein